MVDLQDFGWHGKPVRRYIGVLWGWYGKGGAPQVCVTKMAISTPYINNEGIKYNDTSQFQNIFRLLNEDQLIEGNIQFDLWIHATKEVLEANAINFFVRFDKSAGGSLRVAEITLAENDTITDKSVFTWPDHYLQKIIKTEAPSLQAKRKFYKSKNWVIPERKIVHLETPIEVSVED